MYVSLSLSLYIYIYIYMPHNYCNTPPSILNACCISNLSM